jgi:hypothetical protein
MSIIVFKQQPLFPYAHPAHLSYAQSATDGLSIQKSAKFL